LHNEFNSLYLYKYKKMEKIKLMWIKNSEEFMMVVAFSVVAMIIGIAYLLTN
jgi:hypothetical protein